MKKNNKYFSLIAFFMALLIIGACDDEETIEAPLAFYSFAVSETDNLSYTFTNESLRADSYAWDFGDNVGTSTDKSPTYAYSAAGEYTVVLTATNGGGTNTHSETITVKDNAAVSLIVNGTFEDASAWTIVNFYECLNDRGTVTIGGGNATWAETATAEDGGWKHMAIYQELTLETGTYNVDMHVEYSEIADIWGEAFLGATIPLACTDAEGFDYADNRVLVALNAWDCNQAYTGSAVENACNVPETGKNGEFTIDTAGTYYFVFKVGGGAYGPNGIIVDNITLFKK